jgi:hypothetical protein
VCSELADLSQLFHERRATKLVRPAKVIQSERFDFRDGSK